MEETVKNIFYDEKSILKTIVSGIIPTRRLNIKR